MTIHLQPPTSSPAASTPDAADVALKAKHATMWGLGDYPAVARELIATLGPVVVEALDVKPGQRVLDVAAGTGNAAIPAALAGAVVVATDLTQSLLDVGRAAAEAAGAHLEWRQADAEALPFPAATFDTVLSVVGVMFAPHHQASADELVRVCRPGGRIGLICWTPEGFIGQMFAAMKPFAAPPPPGAQPPPLWGREEHVRLLLGERVVSVSAEKRTVAVTFESGEAFRDFFKRTYGPTIVTYRFIADDPEKVAALDDALAELGRSALDHQGQMEWEYLLVTATRA
ncbi:class I SAM-dependent methyltransferase [Terracoccus luteus]|jgi:SAM-dependent methyltransferase|uniref:Methyltransferase family protein n=1 Tax=Terracoccus luteus TaxID=53356 RepID=A0A495XZC9_9MICO|nr:methyltransferase domain-containing protein [Terracoccus luteus]MBB2985908.1 SAM-dependent methyltransferase [Terracoccus luteus]MCP2171560.1 SAM-dependent methyltransferase [Terracoccus luteus]RKT78659.1 methyltransferase family protein [Terracoccus luteus]